MKDFTINKAEKETYIMNVRKIKRLSGTDCYEIKYADGRRFKNIMCHEDNLTKIEAAQEEQASKAFANKDVFKKLEKKYKLSTLTGVVASGIVNAVPTYKIINGTFMNSNSHIFTLTIGIGTLCVGATLISLLNYINNRGKVAELNKIVYRNEHIADLSNLKKYENSLTGLRKPKKDYFNNTNNPFSIMEIENYSKKDLETIMSNINREKIYNFEYNKKKVKTKETKSKIK